MKMNEILSVIETLSHSQGFYGRLLRSSGAWNGKPKPHRLKIYYTGENAYIKLHGYKIPLDECIRTGV